MMSIEKLSTDLPNGQSAPEAAAHDDAKAVDPNSQVDLSRRSAADLVDDTLFGAARARLREELSDGLAAMTGHASVFADGVVTILARQTAALEKISQRIDALSRSRGEKVRLDPLLFIPESRRLSVTPLARKFQIAANSPRFSGFGWHDAETYGDLSWRWGSRESGSVILPTLGGGKLMITVRVQMPFGLSCTGDKVSVRINDMPLELNWQDLAQSAGTFTASFELQQDIGFSNFVLLIQGGPYEDGTEGIGRDPRQLGIGLVSIIVERQAD